MADPQVTSYKIIMQQAIESLLEYGKEHKGTVEGQMAYDVLLTMQENAEALDISLADIGLTDEIVKSLL